MRALAVSVLCLAGFLAAAGSAAGAPQSSWRVIGGSGPTNLPPEQSEIQRVTVEAEGGAFTLSQKTGMGTGSLSFGSGSAFSFASTTTLTLSVITAGQFAPGQQLSGPGINTEPPTLVESVSNGGKTLSLSQPTTGATIGSVTGASKEVLGVSTDVGTFHPGDTISGIGIPVGTEIEGVDVGSIVLSNLPTAAGPQALTATETTAAIPFGAPGAGSGSVEAALNALPAFGPGTVSVVRQEMQGPEGGLKYFVTFGGTFEDQNVEQLTANGASLTGPHKNIEVFTVTPGGPGTGTISAFAVNVGGGATTGTITLTVGPLPAGLLTSGAATGNGWTCSGGAGETLATCTRAASRPGGLALNPVLVPVRVEAPNIAGGEVDLTVSGGSAASPATYRLPLTVSEEPAGAGIESFFAGAFDETGAAAVQAGGHPANAINGFVRNTTRSALGVIIPAGDPRDIRVDLPPGFIGNPMVTERCPQSLLQPTNFCEAPGANVGTFQVSTQSYGQSVESGVSPTPIKNAVPASGFAAQFSTKFVIPVANLLGSLRSDDDYGVTVVSPNTSSYYKLYAVFASLEGVPTASGGQAFFSNPTACVGGTANGLVVDMTADTWQGQGLFTSVSDAQPPVENCEALEFGTPDVPVGFTFQPGPTQGSTGTSATAHLAIDQAGLTDPAKLATPHLKRSVVTLPEGLNLNPAAANGLEACTTSQMGYKGGNFPAPNPIRFDEEPVGCPDASKVGTAEVTTPLLEDPLQGTVYLGAQGDNPFDSLISLYIVVEDEQTGITLKLPGKVTPNPSTGQLTAEFDNNPQAPFTDLNLSFRGGGPRSTLATPDVCGTHTTNGSWTPWSAPESGPPATTIDSFTVTGNCAPSKAQRPFDIGLSAGVTDPVAGKHSAFALRLTRPDGNQELDTVEAAMPPGFTATLKGVATCTDAQLAGALARSNPGDGKAEIASPSCPASSQIGRTTIGAGVGPEPVYVGGKAYLTGPYKDAPISLAFVVPAVAGPFDLGVQVVRTALNVDPKSAQITAVSDPIPQILSGIPVQIKDVRVNIDRNAFTLNPTSCEAMQIDAKVTGGSGATANLSNRFQVGNCAALGFEPRTNVRLFGGIARGKYQGVRAVVRPRPGDANISRTVVRFPRSAFVAQEHLKDICTRVQYAADACPKRSVYGRAIAYSPLLDEPLRGNVYLRSSDNALPDLVADLRGPAHQPIRVEVAVRNDSVKGALRNTVQAVPDAPVSYFRLQTFGKSKGLIVNSRNICKGKNQARVAMAAHNGRRSVQKVNVFNKRCKAYKRKLRKAKRKAKRGAHRSRLRAKAGWGR